jgi:hypothetical protein
MKLLCSLGSIYEWLGGVVRRRRPFVLPAGT